MAVEVRVVPDLILINSTWRPYNHNPILHGSHKISNPKSIHKPHPYNGKTIEEYKCILASIIQCGEEFRVELKKMLPTHNDMYFMLIDFAMVDLKAYTTGEKRIT